MNPQHALRIDDVCTPRLEPTGEVASNIGVLSNGLQWHGPASHGTGAVNCYGARWMTGRDQSSVAKFTLDTWRDQELLRGHCTRCPVRCEAACARLECTTRQDGCQLEGRVRHRSLPCTGPPCVRRRGAQCPTRQVRSSGAKGTAWHLVPTLLK